MGSFIRSIIEIFKLFHKRTPEEEEDKRLSIERWKSVKAINLEDAKSEFMDTLLRYNFFDVIEEPSNDERLNVLAPEIQALMRRYKRIENNGIWISRDDYLNPDSNFRVIPGFFLIGDDGDFSWVYVKPNEEGIYIEQYDPSDFEGDGIHASVYHWLLHSFTQGDLVGKER